MLGNFKFFTLTLLALVFFAPLVSHAQYPGFDDPGAGLSGQGGSGGLIAVNPTIDGGAIPIGATAQVVVLFRNEGGAPVETGSIRLYPSSTVSAEVTLNQCREEPLGPGAECAVALSIKGLQSGPWRLEMLMSHSGRARLVTGAISGTVESTEGGSDRLSTDIEMIPDDLDFGSLNDAQTLVEPVILRNITSIPIEINDIYIDTSEQAGYSMKADCKSLSAGQSCIATITWSPKQKGRSSGVLVVDHTGPARLSTVSMRGEYAPDDVNEADIFPQAVPGKGLLVSSKLDVDFGTEVDSASSITVSLVNTGNAALSINDIRVSGSDNGLGFKPGGCSIGKVLEPVEACPMTITWSPTRVGDLLDDIQIIHSGARGVLVLPVRGAATATVSQDQKSIILSEIFSNDLVSSPSDIARSLGVPQSQQDAANANTAALSAPVYTPTRAEISSVLDGYKITSFSPTRAIINGPGGSRIVFDKEEVVLGGVPWMVMIQKNGIEFAHKDNRVLLLFDRSLSSINRVTASSENTTGTGEDSSTEDGQ